MKVNAINSFSVNSTPKKPTLNFKNNSPKVSFSGLFDVFQREKETPQALKDDAEIKKAVKASINSDKVLKRCGRAFFEQLNLLLKEGHKKNYRGFMPYVDKNNARKNVTFSEFDENLKIPSVINIWENGKIKTVYEIYSVEPQSTYHLVDYKGDSQTEYNFIGDRNLGYYYFDKEGKVIKQYPSEHGFLQQYATRIGEDEALLLSELYYDYDNPEKSYYRENTENGFIEYLFNKAKKMWYKNRVIPEEEYAQIDEALNE